MQRLRVLVHPFAAVFAIAVACNGDSATGTAPDDPTSAWSGDDPSTSAAVRPALTVPTNTLLADTAGVLAPQGDGGVAVDDRGQAHSHIPIWVPPGRAGIQPNLSLDYASNGGNGIVGTGWGLSGLSRISRCPSLRKYGAIAAPVEWNSGDSFCLDGEPLKPDSDGIYYYKFHFDGSQLRFDGTSWEMRT
ncbi:MAG TPA: SpvB/TcaC N-terminal domain-containing protein, partial [Kofleriaceae bacterium]|nr:SpvB/TcaC N-terminal domain-containing protein [Kofleriaceae bacterium]